MSAAYIRAYEFALCVKMWHAVCVRRIAPNFENCTFGEMQAAEKNAASKQGARRMMALRQLFHGRDYDDVLAIMDCSSRTLARWIARFNNYTIDGLTHDVERPGRPTKIPPDKHEAFKELLRQPYKVGRDFWTARVLHGYSPSFREIRNACL